MRRFIWYEMRFPGRLLNAENVRENSAERLKQVLSPVVALGIPVLGTISDAQKEEVMALSELWPDVPHQTCQFHALQEASRPGSRQCRTTVSEAAAQRFSNVARNTARL